MKIFLYTDNLMTRAQLEDTWRNAGADVFNKSTETKPDLFVIDLTAVAVHVQIQTLRANYPEAEVLTFGSHVDGVAFKQAKAAGATSQVARGKVLERVLKLIQAEEAG
jgi:DNA-binding NarL/FixJ family response regulator